MSILEDIKRMQRERDAFASDPARRAPARIKTAKESRGALAEIIPIGVSRLNANASIQACKELDGRKWAGRFAAAARQIAIHYGTEQAREHAFLAGGLEKIAKLGAPFVLLGDKRPRVYEASKVPFGGMGFLL